MLKNEYGVYLGNLKSFDEIAIHPQKFRARNKPCILFVGLRRNEVFNQQKHQPN